MANEGSCLIKVNPLGVHKLAAFIVVFVFVLNVLRVHGIAVLIVVVVFVFVLNVLGVHGLAVFIVVVVFVLNVLGEHGIAVFML